MPPYDSLLEMDTLPPERKRDLEEQSREFSWQQKVYSPAELLHYVKAVRAREAGEGVGEIQGPLQEEYFRDFRQRLSHSPVEDVLRIPDNGIMLYTITDRDMTLSREVRPVREWSSCFAPPP